MPYFNPDLKNSLLPTFDQVKNYLKLAINEDARYKDTRKLLSFLKRLPAADRHFFGLMQTRKLAVLGFPYRIKFPDDIPTPESEIKKLNEIKQRFRIGKLNKAKAVLMNGVVYGLSAARLTWDNHPIYKSCVRKIDFIDLTDLDYSIDSSDGLDRITTDKTGNFTRSLLDREIHLFMRYNPLEGIDNDFPGAIARTNMIYILLKYWDNFYWAQANEKFSDALIVALYDVKAKPEEIAKVTEGLRNLGNDGKAAFSKDVEIKFLEAVREGIGSMHEKFISSVNNEMSISVLGQNLTTQSDKVGGFALGKVQNYVREDYLYADILNLDDVITEQYIKKDYLMNYGEPRDAFPVYETNVDEAQDFETNARTIAELRAAKVPLLKKEVYEKTGYSIPQAGDDVI